MVQHDPDNNLHIPVDTPPKLNARKMFLCPRTSYQHVFYVKLRLFALWDVEM